MAHTPPITGTITAKLLIQIGDRVPVEIGTLEVPYTLPIVGAPPAAPILEDPVCSFCLAPVERADDAEGAWRHISSGRPLDIHLIPNVHAVERPTARDEAIDRHAEKQGISRRDALDYFEGLGYRVPTE